MASRKSSQGTPAPTPTPSPSRREVVDRMAADLINEKGGKVPARVREYLDDADVRPGLEKLVAAKISLKDIHTKFVSKLGWKISFPVFRAHMRETFNYPEPVAKRVAPAKKKPAKAAKKSTR